MLRHATPPVTSGRAQRTGEAMSELELFDRPTAWRFHAVERLGLSGEDRMAGLAIGAGYPHALVPIQQRLEAVRGTICDIGSGLGGAAAWLGARSRGDVVAVEPELRAVGLARTAFPSLRVVAAGAAALPIASGSCAAATLLGVVSLVKEAGAVFDEVARIVEPGGHVGFTDLVSVDGSTTIRSSGNHLRPLPVLLDALARRGLRVDDVIDVDGRPDARWASIARAVADEVAARHAGTPTYEAWREDSDVLGEMVDRGELRVVTVTASRVVRSAEP
jgi:SAM-dependent methyltransferase